MENHISSFEVAVEAIIRGAASPCMQLVDWAITKSKIVEVS